MSAGAVGGSGINNLILNEEQIREIRHNSAMIGNHMACLGVLITLSVFLVLLSTRRQRRTFLLALQIFAFAIVIVVEILLTVYMYKSNGNILANFVADGPQNLELNRSESTITKNQMSEMFSDVSAAVLTPYPSRSVSGDPQIFNVVYESSSLPFISAEPSMLWLLGHLG